MKWIVIAEAPGLLTFPPERTYVELGPCTIRLKYPVQASSAPYQAPTSWRGLRVTQVAKTAPVDLVIQTSVEAQSQEEARVQGYAEVELALDLVTLTSGGSIAPAVVTHVYKEPVGEPQITVHGEASLVVGTVTVWDHAREDLLYHIGNGLHQLSDRDYRCVRNSVRWLRRAGVEHDPCVQFLFLWFGIEALSSASVVEVKPKTPQCKKCQRPLTCSCGADQSFLPDVRVTQLLVDTCGIWSRKECKERYRLRSKVAHGTIGVLPSEEREIERHVPHLRDAIHAILTRVFNGDLTSKPDSRDEEQA